MDDIDVRIEKKLTEIKENKALLNDECTLDLKESGEPIRYIDGKRCDYYAVKEEVLNLELKMLQNEKNPRLLPLGGETVMSDLDNKRKLLKELEDEASFS